MDKLLVFLLVLFASEAMADGEFGGFKERLEVINVDASYGRTASKARQEIKEIPSEKVSYFAEFAYKRFLASQSQADHTGILEIIAPEMLSEVVEKVMLEESPRYDFLDHEYHFSLTPGVPLNNPDAVYSKVKANVVDPCERSVWNAIFLAKGHDGLKLESNCKSINKLLVNKKAFTRDELMKIYYSFRDIDGY